MLISFLRRKLEKRYWTKTSTSFLNKLMDFLEKSDDVLEFGSSTGHISMKLSENGYRITLLDIRKNVLEEAKNAFSRYGLKAKFKNVNFLEYDEKHDFIWNSGLIQCLDETEKRKFIEHAEKISKKMLLFYPDTDSAKKNLGLNRNQIPGVGDAIEYSVKNVPLYFYDIYDEIYFGRLCSKDIGLDFDMLWIYGEKK